ncbi:uncharacterized protein LOC123320476 [Coccinella septempunctata]|uniref:uncharacterized protein LOC123320476 n=1 Tax=Coccinella septempunctata TaxID=41139 RepID=UPI001D096CB1|nr:uncharacterized protein LOC123320476 [Coccinella septempunctata]
MMDEQRTEAAIEDSFNCVSSIKTIFRSFLSPTENMSRKMLQKYRHFVIRYFPLLLKLVSESRGCNSSACFSPNEVAARKVDPLVEHFSLENRARFVGNIVENRPGPPFSEDPSFLNLMSSTQNPSQPSSWSHPLSTSQILLPQSTSPVQPVLSTQPLSSSQPILTQPASSLTSETFLINVENTLFSQEYSTAQNHLEFVEDKIKLEKNDVSKIAELTVRECKMAAGSEE